MAAESGADVHHESPRWLLRLFDATAEDLAEWSEFDASNAPTAYVAGIRRVKRTEKSHFGCPQG